MTQNRRQKRAAKVQARKTKNNPTVKLKKMEFSRRTIAQLCAILTERHGHFEGDGGISQVEFTKEELLLPFNLGLEKILNDDGSLKGVRLTCSAKPAHGPEDLDYLRMVAQQ